MLNDVAADSLTVSNYLVQISNLSGTAVYDNTLKGERLYSMTLSKSEEKVILAAFASDTTHCQIITSSQNTQLLFDGKGNDLHDKIFVGREYFLEMSDERPEVELRKLGTLQVKNER